MLDYDPDKVSVVFSDGIGIQHIKGYSYNGPLIHVKRKPMTTYNVVSNDGRTTIVSALTYSDAYQKATDFCGDDGLLSMEET